MKLLVAVAFIGFCSAGRLDSSYLPPSGNGNGGYGSGPANGGGGEEAEAPVEIISYENVNNGDGSYKWSYEAANGIKAQEEGELKEGGEEGIQSAVGSYSYTAPDGKEIKVEYTADENGFVPVGDHLPTPPPIPAEIQKLLDDIAAAEEAKEAEGNGKNGNGKNGNGYRY